MPDFTGWPPIRFLTRTLRYVGHARLRLIVGKTVESMPSEKQSPAILRFGVFEVDVRAGELRKQGVQIKLQEQPFHVLTVLLQRPGEVITREELRNQSWPADTFVDFDNSLNTAINKLREALGDSADNPRFIETLPRRGYRFVAQVTGVDGTATGTATGASAAAPTRRRKTVAT